MPWVRLDDGFADHPKIERAGPLAAWLHVVALCYCARHLTDGRIPQTKARRLADIPTPGKHIQALVDAGLWEEDGDDYVLHDYLDYQPSRADVEDERADARDRMAKRRRAKTGTFARSSPEQLANNGRSSADVQPPRGSPTPSRPDPKTLLTSSLVSTNGAAPPVDDDDQILAAVPGEVWVTYAELMLAKQPDGTIKQPAAWKRRTRENANIEHGDTAARWWDQYRLTPSQLAQCLIDGKAPRNEYRRKDPA